MSADVGFYVTFGVYKVCSLLVGTAFAYMGYRLFMAGVWGGAGDLDAQLKNLRLILKRAAPGTFFVVFGAAIVGFTVFKGLDMKGVEQHTGIGIKTLIQGAADIQKLKKAP